MALFTYEQLHTNSGQRKTRSLFHEVSPTPADAIATLGRHEKEGLVNIRSLFIDFCVDDPTEIDFAEHVFGDYSFWHWVAQSYWIKEYLEEWRMICDVKRKRKAFKGIMEEVEGGGRSAFTASKFLIDEPWKDKRKPENKQRSRKSTEAAAESYKEDFARLKDYTG